MPPVYCKDDVGTFYPQPSVSVRHIDARRPAPNGRRPIPASITSTTASYTSLEPNSWRESCLIFFYLKLSGGASPKEMKSKATFRCEILQNPEPNSSLKGLLFATKFLHGFLIIRFECPSKLPLQRSRITRLQLIAPPKLISGKWCTI